MSKKVVKSVKKRRIKWREIIFHLHRFDISSSFDLFRSSHKDMSINRCAYNVLKTYYSTTAMRFIKNYFEKTTLTEEEVVEWFNFYLGLKCL